ncbi:16S rRNA processing protein RimM [Buchnera aphidicola (Brachycaudus cardui)]|uniref:16S rRNA processing protein RimM n=1 Tax=Buchnera aphidicola (Brachycaudus cardui) TaxID=557993 RepID=A0A4D6XXF2_9GAMM|nr:16S rRNA processing protein RimM [Buchnera aphidicola (Brachycaudus cardui)]
MDYYFFFYRRKIKNIRLFTVVFCKKKIIKIQLTDWKPYKNNFIVHIKDISNRSLARELTNSDIIISKYTLPTLKKNEYYWNDLINYKVFNTHKHYLGKVIDLMRAKNNDILVVKNTLKISKKNIFIPFIEQKIIRQINSNYKFITVQWD